MTENACTPTDRILQSIAVRAPGVTNDLVNLELFNIMDEFFKRTSAWRHQDDIQLEQGTIEYNFGVPSGALVVRMIGVSHNGIPVPNATQGGSAVQTGSGKLDPALYLPDGDAMYTPDASDLAGDIFSWAVYRPDVITINVPSSEQVKFPAIVDMALTLGRSCLECEDCSEWNVPEWMWDMYFQDWLDGTLARLYGMPAKPWNNTTMASYHGKRFRNAMGLRKQETPRGFVFGAPGPWRFPGGWTR